MPWMRRLNLRNRILLGFFITLVVFGLISLYIIVVVQDSQQTAAQIIQRYLPINGALLEFKTDALEVLSSTVEVSLLTLNGGDPGQIDEETEQLVAAQTAASSRLEQIQRDITESFPALQPQFEAIQTQYAEFLDLGQALIETSRSDSPQAEFEESKEVYEEAEQRLLESINAVLTSLNADIDFLNTEFAEISVLTPTTLIATLVVGLGFSALGAVAGSRSIARPIEELKTTVTRIARGDYSQRAPAETQDEIGMLARSFNDMAEAVEQREHQLKQQIDEIRASRDEAERANRVKDAFLASMSHELRTPLNAIINFTRFVVDGDTGPINEQQAELLTDVVRSGKHLLNLINDVLDMSKIEAGSLNLFIEDDIDVAALIRQAVATGQGLLGDKPVVLRAEIAPDLPHLRGDRQRILQILLNLISNACKFTEEGEIVVRAERKDDQLMIAVADTGPGIAPEDHALVFEPFKQTETGLRQQSGTGLGMPIARKLAEAHHGRLWLESEPGKGATFYVELPVAALEPVRAPAFA
jgi:signal transduction histidine kinase